MLQRYAHEFYIRRIPQSILTAATSMSALLPMGLHAATSTSALLPMGLHAATSMSALLPMGLHAATETSRMVQNTPKATGSFQRDSGGAHIFTPRLSII